MSEKDTRSFLIMLRRALMMIVAWADEWLAQHPAPKERVQ